LPNTTFIDSSEFDRAVRVLEHEFDPIAAKVVSTALRQSGNVVRNSVRKEAAPHRRTGKMRGQVRMKMKGRGLRTTARVSAGGSAAGLVIRGVKPHPIAPGKVMPLWGGRGRLTLTGGRGIEGFATAVEHPGFDADPFFARGMMAAMPQVHTIIGQGAATLASDLARKLR
jgi:hypothetical protein